MTYTLEQAKADYEALGKRIAELEKKPETCPLEEGKEVEVQHLDLERLDSLNGHSGFVQVVENSELRIRIPFRYFPESALRVARALIGGSSD